VTGCSPQSRETYEMPAKVKISSPRPATGITVPFAYLHRYQRLKGLLLMAWASASPEQRNVSTFEDNTSWPVHTPAVGGGARTGPAGLPNSSATKRLSVASAAAPGPRFPHSLALPSAPWKMIVGPCVKEGVVLPPYRHLSPLPKPTGQWNPSVGL
jgi:hypothetical protein